MWTRLSKHIKTAGWVVFSALVWVACFTCMACVVIVWAATSIFYPLQVAQQRFGNPLMAQCLRLTGSSVKVIHDPAFEPKRRAMFVQNHVNLLDAHAACAAVPQAFCGIMNAWQFKIPFYGPIMKKAGGIPVRSGGANRFAEVAEAARERVARGLSILVYPEAHRTRDGKVADFKKGVFLMARDAGLPIVPVATRGMYEMNRKGTWLFRPSKVSIYVGAPIETAGLDNDALLDVIARTHKIIQDFSEHGIIPTRTGAGPAPTRPGT